MGLGCDKSPQKFLRKVSDVSTPEPAAKFVQEEINRSPWRVQCIGLLARRILWQHENLCPRILVSGRCQEVSKWLKVAQSGSSIPYELIKTYMSLALRSLRDGAMPLQESSEQWPRQTWDMPRELAWRRPIRWSRKGSKTEKNEDEPRWTKMNQGDIRRSGEENAKSHL